MRFWSHLDHVKLDKTKDTLTKAFEYQKFFLKVVMQNYSSNILFL